MTSIPINREDMERACSNKRRYPTKQVAKHWAKIYEGITGNKQAPYRCRYCREWHLTTTRHRRK